MQDDKIPINLKPYTFYKEDHELAAKIIGLKFDHMVNPKPFGPSFFFEVNKDSTSQNFLNFLDSLPDEFELRYFKPFDLNNSVAGTEVVVQKGQGEYFFRYSSHGQDNVWKQFSKTELLKELFMYRTLQTFNAIKVGRK